MKKIILIISISILSMVAQSCGSYVNLEKEQKAIAKKILECLDEDNAEELKSMFCEKSLEESNDIDRQIKRAMEFFEGETESFDTDNSIAASDERYFEGGKVVRLRSSGSIKDIITDQDKKYSIEFYNYLVYKENPDHVGIREITIYSEDGRERKIGKYFP